jgi:hypothetical protein
MHGVTRRNFLEARRLKIRLPSLTSTVVAKNAASGNQELNHVLQIPVLRITKLFDLFMLEGPRSAKLMCNESYIRQVFDNLHLLKGFQ